MLLLCSRRACCFDLASALGGNSGSENGSENGGDFFSIVTGPGSDGFEPEKKKKKQPWTHTDRKEGECGRERCHQ
jgi:hypothetical protein